MHLPWRTEALQPEIARYFMCGWRRCAYTATALMHLNLPVPPSLLSFWPDIRFKRRHAADVLANWQISNVGEMALLVAGGDRISESLISQVHRLKSTLLTAAVPGIRDLVPAYASLLVIFDPYQISEEALRAAVTKGLEQVTAEVAGPPSSGRHHIVPVHYGGEYGPDLERVAAAHDLGPSQAIELHSQRHYKVAFKPV